MPYENIPAELKALRQWCCWRYEQRPKAEKPTKPCYNPLTNAYASVTDPATWVDFATAVSHAHRYDGIGFVFTRADPYAGIDLDATQDPNLWASHNAVYNSIISYSERSPSGEGAHIIVRAKLAGPGRRKYKVELYDCERYLTFTGNVIDNRVTIIDAQPLIDQLYSELGGEDNGGTACQGSEREVASDADILARARNAKNGERFNALFEGAWSTAVGDSGSVQYPSQSEADQALVNIIAFYTQSAEQIIRIFRSSALGQRDKARRGDYCARLVRKALDRKMPTEALEAAKMSAAPHLAALNEKLASTPIPPPLFRPFAEFAAEYTPLRYVVDGIIVRGSLYTLTSRTGAGKTTWLSSLAVAIASADGAIVANKIEGGNVAYMTFENPDDFRMKIIAASVAHRKGVNELGGLLISDMSIKPEAAIEALAKRGVEYSLIIIDTLQAAFDGKDFNDNKGILDFIRRCRGLTGLPGRPSVIIAAHPVKSAQADNLLPYGGGSIINEIDGNLTLQRDGETNITTLHYLAKFRGPEFAPRPFRIEAPPCAGLLDIEGRIISPPVVYPITTEAAETIETVAEEREMKLLQIIRNNAMRSLRDMAQELGYKSQVSVSKALKRLQDAKLIEQIGVSGAWEITKRGKKALDMSYTRGLGI